MGNGEGKWMTFQKASGYGDSQRHRGHWLSGAGLYGNEQRKGRGTKPGVAPVLRQFLM